MNQLGLACVWCVIQVTIVSLVAGGCYALVRSRGPAVRSTVVMTGLTVIVALTLMAASPWPNWDFVALRELPAEPVGPLVTGQTAARAGAAAPAGVPDQPPSEPQASEPGAGFAFGDFLEAFTFLRRIEMLRDPKQMVSAAPMGTRAVAVAAVLSAGLLAVGLRGGGPGPAEGMATEPALEGQQSAPAAAPFALSYLPRDAAVVAALRPATLLARDQMQPLAETLAKEGGLEEVLGSNLLEASQVTVGFLLDNSPRRAPEPAVTVVHLATPAEGRVRNS